MANESSERKPLVALATSPRRMPPGWTPPAPAWSASFAELRTPIVMAYFGTQLAPDDTRPPRDRMRDFFARGVAPLNVESATFIDRSGRRNLLSIGYWTDPARYHQWNVDSGFEAWWNDPARMRDDEGYFREILTVPKERFETIFVHDYLVGAAKLGDTVLGPVREHGYWGSMRDRFEVSADNDLVSPYGQSVPRNASQSTAGHRMRVQAPENLTVIRSGQDWSECAGDEFAFYDESVHPLLRDAMHFLRDNPAETGCCEMRFAQQFAADGAMLKKTFGLGHFLSLGHLEQWAASDERHLTIFSRFGRMAREFRSGLRLKLWHEVSVLPASGQIFEYINCHDETGVLPFFPSLEW